MKQFFEIFETMRMLGLVTNQSDFAVNWLGKSRCYMSYLKRTGGYPSVTSMALLVEKLKPEVEAARAHGDAAISRPLRSALVAAQMIHNGLYELKYVPPWYRITAV